jgi:hypothetical protein
MGLTSTVPSGLAVCAGRPGAQAPGYCRSSLRDDRPWLLGAVPVSQLPGNACTSPRHAGRGGRPPSPGGRVGNGPDFQGRGVVRGSASPAGAVDLPPVQKARSSRAVAAHVGDSIGMRPVLPPLVSRPFGTWLVPRPVPALKRRAILGSPLGTAARRLWPPDDASSRAWSQDRDESGGKSISV